MHRYQIKQKRPTIQTAHDFHKEGHYRHGHAFSGEERRCEITKVCEELCELVRLQFPRTKNLEFAILKCHLVVEHAITQYIRCFARTAVDLKDIKFGFSQKLEAAYLMGFGADHPTLLPTIERLNKVRNQVAHRFTLDRDALDEMLRINSGDYETYLPKNDQERIRHLKSICAFICGAIAGRIEATYWFNCRPNE